jgi:hypothetical protein
VLELSTCLTEEYSITAQFLQDAIWLSWSTWQWAHGQLTKTFSVAWLKTLGALRMKRSK